MKNIAIIVVNILDFMNHPEVELKYIEANENPNRIKKGKFPKLDRVIIVMKGKLYKYVYETLPLFKDRKKIGCQYIVRGHYMHFWNKKKWRRLYLLNKDELNKMFYQIDESGLISKWKNPFLKGEGNLKNTPLMIKEGLKK